MRPERDGSRHVPRRQLIIVTVSPAGVAMVLAGFVAVLVAAGFLVEVSTHVFNHDYLMGFARLFHLDREMNVPSWYSTVSLLLAAGLLGMIAVAKRRESAPYAGHWMGLCLLFVALSIDEGAQIHGVFTIAFKTFATANPPPVLRYPWVLAGAAFVLIVALAYRRFVFDLPARTRRLFMASAALFVSGALVVEWVSGIYHGIYGSDNLFYGTLTTVEEALEMLGVLVFIYALLDYMTRLDSDYLFEVRPAR